MAEQTEESMPSSVRQQISDLYNSPEYISLSAYYDRKTIFDILGMARREDVHSNFLAWLLNPQENHGLKSFALKKFLQLLVKAKDKYQCNASVPFEEALQNHLLLEDWSIKSASVEREVAVSSGDKEKDSRLDKKDSRLDILLTIVFDDDSNHEYPVIIENKVKSDEHGDQTNRYHKWADNKYADKEKYAKPLFVFLTPKKDFSLVDETTRCATCQNDDFILINYQDIIDNLLEPCLAKGMDGKAELFVKDYLRCLSFSNINDNEGELIMGTSTEERELLRQFWDKNRSLLLATIDVLQTDEEIPAEDRESMAQASKNLKKSAKDLTKYNFLGTKYPKSRLVLAVLKAYVNDHKEVTFAELKKEFPNELQGSCGVIQDYSKVDKPNNYFTKDNEIITLADGTKVVVCCQWAAGVNFPKFMEHVNVNLASYKITEVQ